MKRMIANGFGSAGRYPQRGSSALSTYLRRMGKALRLRGPLADDPTAQTLHALLVGLACAMILEFAFLPVNTTKTAVASLVVSFTVLCIAAPLVLLRRGSLRSASLTFLSGSWVLFTFVIIFNGGIRSVGAVYYLVLPISAAWLLGYRAALVSAGICLGSLLIMAVLDVSGHPMPRYIPGNPLGIWASVVEAMIMAAVPIARILQIYKEALARLRESEERFRNMADTAPVMIWVSGVDKLCTFFNKPWLTFTGRTMEQELGNGWVSSVHPDDLDRCLAVYSSSFDAHRNFEMEYRLRRADGEYRWILDNGKPLYRDEEFVGFIGSCIDVTEQKLIEQRLRANEVQLTDAQRLARVGSFEVHIDSDRLYWSDEISRIFGVTNRGPSDFATFLQSVHPKDREKVLESARKVRSTGATVETEYRIVRPDGEVRFVRSIVEAIRNDQRETVRLAGATQDLTEQVQARELLRESEQRLKNAERLAHLGHWQWHLKSNQLIWSEECYRIYGQPPNYTPSLEDLLQTLVPEDRVRVERETGRRLAEKKGGAIEFRIIRPDGKLRTIRSLSEMLLDEEGEPESFFGACQDITEEKRTQEESVARQKLASVGVLAAGISHDFNNVLGAILAEAELAEVDLPRDSSPVEEIQRIKASAIRGAEIVRELMIYAGKDQASPIEPVDVSWLVAEMLELLRASISKHAVLTANLQKNLPAVWGNAAKIRQVVMNLVLNASEAMGEKGGAISVITEHVSAGKKLALNGATDLPEGDYVRLEVSDTGCGITEEARTKIFDPFFSTKFVGRGLGLAVVQGIVHEHGGTIDLMSTPGLGTTFQVFLSCAAKASNARNSITPVGAGQSQSNGRTGTVLVAEDEEVLERALTKALIKSGFSVMEASDGSAAMELIRAHLHDIDVVLLDVTLPGMTSREVFEEIQRIRPDLKVILTSADGKQTVDAAFAGLRIEHFIRKPFQLGDLVNMLQGVVLC